MFINLRLFSTVFSNEMSDQFSAQKRDEQIVLQMALEFERTTTTKNDSQLANKHHAIKKQKDGVGTQLQTASTRSLDEHAI